MAQGIQQPQPFNPERLLALKSMLGQQQLQQQQIQGSELENKIRTQQLQDRQTLQEIAPKYVKKNDDGQPTGFDYDGFSADAQQRGVSPATMSQLATMQKTYADTLKAKADAGQTTLQTQEKLLGDAYNHLEGIRGETDPAQRQAKWQSALQWAQQNNLPGAANLPPQAPDDKMLTGTEAQLGMHAQAVADVKAQTDIQKSQAETAEATTAAQKNQAEMQGLTGQFAEAKYRNILSQISAGKPVSDDDITFAKGYEAANKKSTTQSDTLGVTTQSTTGPAGLASVGNRQGGKFVASGSGGPSPGNASTTSTQSTKDSLVDLIGQYKADPMVLTRLMLRHPDILAEVHAKYPDWDQTSYQAKNKLIQGYTSGPQSKEINSISTAMGHIGNLYDAIGALDNGNMTALNRIGTYYNINVAGKTPEAAFQLIARRVGPEITSAYIPGAGGEGERIANEKDFDVNLPPQTLRNNAAVTVKLLRSKISSLENQYQNTVGRNDFEQRFLTPEARASLQKFGGSAPSGGHIIKIGTDQYQYNGSGDTADLKNYTKLPAKQ